MRILIHMLGCCAQVDSVQACAWACDAQPECVGFAWGVAPDAVAPRVPCALTSTCHAASEYLRAAADGIRSSYFKIARQGHFAAGIPAAPSWDSTVLSLEHTGPFSAEGSLADAVYRTDGAPPYGTCTVDSAEQLAEVRLQLSDSPIEERSMEEAACLRRCADFPGATGCLTHSEDGCFVYTSTSVAWAEHAQDDQRCWVFWRSATVDPGAVGRVYQISGDLRAPARGDYRFRLSAGKDLLTALRVVQSTHGDPCNGGVVMAGGGRINFGPADDSVECEWTAHCPGGIPVATFTFFDTERNFDQVFVDGEQNGRSGTYDDAFGAYDAGHPGRSGKLRSFQGESEAMVIRFTSDSSVQSDGFSADITCSGGEDGAAVGGSTVVRSVEQGEVLSVTATVKRCPGPKSTVWMLSEHPSCAEAMDEAADDTGLRCGPILTAEECGVAGPMVGTDAVLLSVRTLALPRSHLSFSGTHGTCSCDTCGQLDAPEEEAWCALDNVSDSWLQLTPSQDMFPVGVAIGGRKLPDQEQFVRTFSVSWENEVGQWEYILCANETPCIFEGNTDSQVVEIPFNVPGATNFPAGNVAVRIHPLEFHLHRSLRAGLIVAADRQTAASFLSPSNPGCSIESPGGAGFLLQDHRRTLEQSADGLSACLADCAAAGYNGAAAPELTEVDSCGQLTTEEECVASKEPSHESPQHEACHWCCGDECFSDSQHMCQPERLIIQRAAQDAYVGHSRNGLGYSTCEATGQETAVAWTSFSDLPSCAMGCLLYSQMEQTHSMEKQSWLPMCRRHCQAAGDAECDYEIPGFVLNMCNGCASSDMPCVVEDECNAGCEFSNRALLEPPVVGAVQTASDILPDRWVFSDDFEVGADGWTTNDEGWFLETCEANGGLVEGTACCLGACGMCGGTGCGDAPGGAASCCAETVSSNSNPDRVCTRNGAMPPCNYVADEPDEFRSLCYSYGSILGGNLLSGRGAYFEKTYDLSEFPHTYVHVDLVAFAIKSWDYGEAVQVFLDDVNIWEGDRGEHGYETRCDNVDTQVLFVSAENAHTRDTAVLRVTSTLDEPAPNESIGIDNVKLTVGSGTMTGVMFAGEAVFFDTDTPTFTNIAAPLVGLEFIRSVSADYESDPSRVDWICLDMLVQHTLHVLFDSRATGDKPNWLTENFDKQDTVVETSDDSIVYGVWSMRAATPGEVCLGGNAAAGAQANYIVAMGPLGHLSENVQAVCQCQASRTELSSWSLDVTYPDGTTHTPGSFHSGYGIYPPLDNVFDSPRGTPWCSMPAAMSAASPDAQALIRFAQDLGDSVGALRHSVTRLHGPWVEERDPCGGWVASHGWQGVTCEEEALHPDHGRIVSLKIPLLGLSGSIEAIGTLGGLRTLDLSDNAFTGNLRMLQNLTRLVELRLARNDLTGELLGLERMHSLQVLDLQHNTGLVGSLTAVGSLKQLEFLRLSFNDGLEGDLGDLSELLALQRLGLSGIGITGTLSTLAHLPVLEFVDLRNNSVAGSLVGLASMKSLRQLLVDGNGGLEQQVVVPEPSLNCRPDRDENYGTSVCTATVGQGYITRCPPNTRVNFDKCTPCPPGTTNDAGDEIGGEDTFCDAIFCDADERVVEHECVPCQPGATNAKGDDASGETTICDTSACRTNEHVWNHACVRCPPGTTNDAGNEPTGSDTACQAVLCEANDHVSGNSCVACAPGKYTAAGHNASGSDTVCTATLCAINQYVQENVCADCRPGTTHIEGADASGADTACTVTLCDANEHVVGNECVACEPGSIRDAGDDASGDDTACREASCSDYDRDQCPEVQCEWTPPDQVGNLQDNCDAGPCPEFVHGEATTLGVEATGLSVCDDSWSLVNDTVSTNPDCVEDRADNSIRLAECLSVEWEWTAPSAGWLRFDVSPVESSNRDPEDAIQLLQGAVADAAVLWTAFNTNAVTGTIRVEVAATYRIVASSSVAVTDLHMAAAMNFCQSGEWHLTLPVQSASSDPGSIRGTIVTHDIVEAESSPPYAVVSVSWPDSFDGVGSEQWVRGTTYEMSYDGVCADAPENPGGCGQGQIDCGDGSCADTAEACTAASTGPRTCADTNGDGVGGDPHNCSNSDYGLSNSPEGIECSGESCTDTECCIEASTQEPECAEPMDTTGYTLSVNSLGMSSFNVTVECAQDYNGTAVATVCEYPDQPFTLSGCT